MPSAPLEAVNVPLGGRASAAIASIFAARPRSMMPMNAKLIVVSPPLPPVPPGSRPARVPTAQRNDSLVLPALTEDGKRATGGRLDDAALGKPRDRVVGQVERADRVRDRTVQGADEAVQEPLDGAPDSGRDLAGHATRGLQAVEQLGQDRTCRRPSSRRRAP